MWHKIQDAYLGQNLLFLKNNLTDTNYVFKNEILIFERINQ